MSATIASAIGISIATNVRKTISSTMIAASRPRASEIPCSSGGNSASPLNSTVTPAGSTVSRTASCTATTGVAVLVLDRLVELRLGVGDPAVVGERVLAERVADARDPGRAVGGLELGRLERAIAFSDRRLARRRVEPLALRRREDDVQDAALLGGELRLDQVGRLLRVRARDRELVPQGAADRRDEHDQDRDDADPAEDDAPRMPRAGAHPAREPARCQALVRRQPLRRPVLLVLRHVAFALLGSVGLAQRYTAPAGPAGAGNRTLRGGRAG